jgi:hypothetical protein
MVVGDNVEEQLRPFHEFECTGVDDEYVQDIDVTEEILKYIEEAKAEGNPCDPQTVFEYHYGENSKYSYIEFNDSAVGFRAIRRTNPNAQWDWYQIGGRWSGFFRLKEDSKSCVMGKDSLVYPSEKGQGLRADSALKGDIDFDAMRKEAHERATEEFDKFESIAGPFSTEGPLFRTWKEIFCPNGVYRGDRPVAEAEYDNQPIVKKVHESEHNHEYFFGIDQFSVGRERYVAEAVKTAYRTYALLYEGNWYAKGEMGWWGMSADGDIDAYNQLFHDIVDNLSDDTRLTLVDCHI